MNSNTKIYKQTDRFRFKIDTIEFGVKPLSYQEKNMITGMMIEGQQKKNMAMLADSTMYAVRCCLKELKGLEYDGKEYELEFGEDGILTADCMSDLMNLELSAKILNICSLFIQKVPTEFTVEGVSFVEVGNVSKKKQD